MISRTFRDEGGREYVRHEVVKNQAVIDAYVRIMSGSREKDMRMQFAEKDEQTREDMRKEVKKLAADQRWHSRFFQFADFFCSTKFFVDVHVFAMVGCALHIVGNKPILTKGNFLLQSLKYTDPYVK